MANAEAQTGEHPMDQVHRRFNDLLRKLSGKRPSLSPENVARELQDIADGQIRIAEVFGSLCRIGHTSMALAVRFDCASKSRTSKQVYRSVTKLFEQMDLSPMGGNQNGSLGGLYMPGLCYQFYKERLRSVQTSHGLVSIGSRFIGERIAPNKNRFGRS